VLFPDKIMCSKSSQYCYKGITGLKVQTCTLTPLIVSIIWRGVAVFQIASTARNVVYQLAHCKVKYVPCLSF